ncbi:hypothetical protein A5721_16395 [Mycobacterium vulneris]|nr:hypothetical protein A5721_16395 [Mycolicibacterium vulneris]
MSELDEALAARRRDAYAKLDEAIEELSSVFCDADGEIPIDAVLIVGAQSVDDDGDRVGGITVFPRHGSQPLYITSGLMSHGLAVLARQGANES